MRLWMVNTGHQNEVRQGMSFKVGDKVHFDADSVSRRPEFAGTFEVEKVNKVNLKVTKTMPEANGRKITVNAHPMFLEAGEGQTYADAMATVATVAVAEFIGEGTLVYVDHHSRKMTPGFYVIAGETRTGFKLNPLGGRGAAWRSVHRKSFTVVDFTEDMKNALTLSAHQQMIAGV